jgi:tRNA dimethylallyltransferase
MSRRPLIVILGPTASGKTSFAVELCETIGGEVVSMDSTAVYRGFDIGSSKPTPEERARVPHHLVDVLDPDENFSAHHFVRLAEEAIESIYSRGKLAVLVGGTYFYLRALQHGMYPDAVIANEILEEIEKEFFEEDALNTHKIHAEIVKKDPESAKAIHPNDRYRCVRTLALIRSGQIPSTLKPVPSKVGSENHVWMKYAITLPRHQLNQSMANRVDKMLQLGLLEETKRLLASHPQSRALASVGYAEAAAFLQNRLTEKQLRNEIIEKTRQLAKRQLTWLRSDTEIRFIDHRDRDRVVLEINNLKAALGEKAV